MQQTLMTKTLTLLEADTRPYLEVATGSGVPYHWLCKFAQGAYRDPSVNKVQQLYEYLAQLPLKFG